MLGIEISIWGAIGGRCNDLLYRRVRREPGELFGACCESPPPRLIRKSALVPGARRHLAARASGNSTRKPPSLPQARPEWFFPPQDGFPRTRVSPSPSARALQRPPSWQTHFFPPCLPAIPPLANGHRRPLRLPARRLHRHGDVQERTLFISRLGLAHLRNRLESVLVELLRPIRKDGIQVIRDPLRCNRSCQSSKAAITAESFYSYTSTDSWAMRRVSRAFPLMSIMLLR